MTKHRLTIILLAIALFLSLVLNVYLVYVLDPLHIRPMSLVEQLKQHMVIYEEEEPSVSTIKDVELLKQANFEFYRDAQNGDRVIFFPKRAIVYRESERKIISVAIITISDTEQ